MKLLQKRPVAAGIMVLAVLAAVLIGQARKPVDTGEPSTAIVGTYTYVYDNAGVLTDETMSHIDAMNVSLFAQTGAQILVETVDTTGDKTMEEYAIDLGNQYHVGDAERNNGVVILLALDNIAQNGLVGDYWVVGGDGLASYGNELTSLLVANMEADFAAGDYDAAVEKTFDLRPTAIIRDLDLRRPIYRKLAAYGHMGREDLGVAWEKTDRVDALKAALAE